MFAPECLPNNSRKASSNSCMVKSTVSIVAVSAIMALLCGEVQLSVVKDSLPLPGMWMAWGGGRHVLSVRDGFGMTGC